MKLIYLSVDGTARVETTKLRARQVEEPDGNHPVTNDSVWQDAKRLRDSIMLIIQGVRGPYGATMEVNDVVNVLYEIKLKERAFKSQSVSKMNWRMFEAAGAWLMKYLPLLFFVGIAAWAVSSAFTGGM